MKMSTSLLLCMLATLPLAVPAQESSKTDPGPGGMEIGELLTRFAKRNGKQFAIDPRVRGQVPLAGIDVNQITYEQLLAILDVHQFAVVNAGGVLAVVPDANARQFPTPVYTDLDFKAADYETVTMVIAAKKVCTTMLVPILRPLQPQAAHLAADPQTNSLIISDHAVNARRIAALVAQLDQRGSGAKDCWPTPAPAKSGS
jgi:general secretion pathway protein D